MTRAKWAPLVAVLVLLIVAGIGACGSPRPAVAPETLSRRAERVEQPTERQPTPDPPRAREVAPRAPSGRTARLDYTVLDEETYDAPIKTQVTLKVLVPAKASRVDLEALLGTLYSSIAARRGYKYHDAPTSVWIYAYTSREFAEAGLRHWIAMLSKAHSDPGPNVSFNEAQFAQRTVTPEIKFGLSEEQRKEIFHRLGDIGVESQAAADRAHPYGPSATHDELLAWAEYDSEFRERKHQELADRYDITTDDLARIVTEGMNLGWR